MACSSRSRRHADAKDDAGQGVWSKYSNSFRNAEFRETLAVAGVKCLRLPPRSPNLNAFAERWVRSVKEECLSHLILFGERSLRKALTQFQEHYKNAS